MNKGHIITLPDTSDTLWKSLIQSPYVG